MDFRAARRRIEGQTQFAGSTRRQAFAVYVGLFDLADDDGRIEIASVRLAEALGTTRVSWLAFREILEAADLISIGPFRGGHPIVLELRAPAPVD